MRVLESEIKIIKNSIYKYISDAKIILFGSRIDDTKKGGDIDIFVQTNNEISLKEQIKILTEIELNGIMRKVDLVLQTPNSKELSIFATAKKEGIVL